MNETRKTKSILSNISRAMSTSISLRSGGGDAPTAEEPNQDGGSVREVYDDLDVQHGLELDSEIVMRRQLSIARSSSVSKIDIAPARGKVARAATMAFINDASLSVSPDTYTATASLSPLRARTSVDTPGQLVV